MVGDFEIKNFVIRGERRFSDKLRGEKQFVEILKMFSPGTSLRNALDDLLRSRMGALLAVDKEGLSNIFEGGFRINSKFSPQKLVELAKMDGAIILSKDLKKILYSNTLLFPDVRISTKETGTRHKAAERTAKQIGTIVIAVSERKQKITIYYKTIKYELKESSEILRRATETLQILEKQKEIFNDLLANLNISEVSNTVSMSDVCGVLQSIEVLSRISEIVKRYLIELGREGIIVSMRLKELTKNINIEEKLILGDYFGSKCSKIDSLLEGMTFDSLLELSNLQKLLFGDVHDKSIFPSGRRILSKILDEKNINILLNNFKNLGDIFSAGEEELSKVLKGDEAKLVIQDIENLREKILVGKKI